MKAPVAESINGAGQQQSMVFRGAITRVRRERNCLRPYFSAYKRVAAIQLCVCGDVARHIIGRAAGRVCQSWPARAMRIGGSDGVAQRAAARSCVVTIIKREARAGILLSAPVAALLHSGAASFLLAAITSPGPATPARNCVATFEMVVLLIAWQQQLRRSVARK